MEHVLYKDINAAVARAKKELQGATEKAVQREPLVVRCAKALYRGIAGVPAASEEEVKLRARIVVGMDGNGIPMASTEVKLPYWEYSPLTGQKVVSTIQGIYEASTQRSDAQGYWERMAQEGYRIVWFHLLNWKELNLTSAKALAAVAISKTGKSWGAFSYPHHNGGTFGTKCRLSWEEKKEVVEEKPKLPIDAKERIAEAWSMMQEQGLALLDKADTEDGDLMLAEITEWRNRYTGLLAAAADLTAVDDLLKAWEKAPHTTINVATQLVASLGLKTK